jgi:enoyl-CoA hydratase/carnithine racemase
LLEVGVEEQGRRTDPHPEGRAAEPFDRQGHGLCVLDLSPAGEIRYTERVSNPPDDAGEVAVTTADGVATLWLNRPAKRNAVTYEMWRAIADACQALAADPAIRLLVVRGAGEHFCAGADIGGLGEVPRAEYEAVNGAADDALVGFPKPTIAYVTGSCVGGGTEIAVACDLRLADTTARFGITPARLGIVYPAFALERVVRLIGPSAAKHLLYTAEIVGAERALRIGLVDEVHPPDAAAGRLDELVDLLAHQRSLLTQMASKEMVDAVVGQGHVDGAVVRRWHHEVAASSDPAEGRAAFLERRPPTFTWTPGPPKPPTP